MVAWVQYLGIPTPFPEGSVWGKGDMGASSENCWPDVVKRAS
jgi:hypothetical protein